MPSANRLSIDFGSANLLIPLVGVGLLLLLLVVFGKIPLRYSLRNLLVRWKTTFMTAMAFTLVVALLTVMLAFVNGMYRLTESSGQPGNVMVLSDGATDEQFSNLGYNDSSDVVLQPGVRRDAEGKPLASKEVYIVVNQVIPSLTGGKPKRRFVQLRGIEDPMIAGEVHGLSLLPGGSWFSPSGVRDLPEKDKKKSDAAIEAVLGQGVAGEMGRDRGKETLVVGDTFELGPRTFIVTGVMDSSGSTFGSEIWAKQGIVGPMFGKENYTSIVLRAENADAAKELADRLRSNYKKAALNAQPEQEYFSKLSDTNKQFTFAIVFVAIVMAIGGVFGVMNTMFAAISQRQKDIGVLKIIGFNSGQILTSFIVESLLLALMGGLVGCAIGSIADGWTASSIVSGGAGGGKFVVLKLVVNFNILATGLLLSLAMGLLGGFLPALRAVRLKPLESLR